MPAKPKTWVDEEGMSFPLQYDNKVSVRQEAVKLENGTISDGWCVTEGDPTGNHKLKGSTNRIGNGRMAKDI